MACALLFQFRLFLVYWNNTILTATYLINRLPSTLLRDRSPFEVLNNKLPSYKHLKAFGCLCYASTLLSKRDKFTPRACACILIGYPARMKAYKLLDIELNIVFISIDVVFHETIFPLVKTSSSSEDVSSLFNDKTLPLPVDDFATQEIVTRSFLLFLMLIISVLMLFL